MRFHSILFEESAAGVGREEPPFFPDLHLDQVLDSLTSGRKEYGLEPFFYSPLRSAEAVRYRREVLRDLEDRAVLETVREFAKAMRGMRGHLAQAEKLHYELQKQR